MTMTAETMDTTTVRDEDEQYRQLLATLRITFTTRTLAAPALFTTDTVGLYVQARSVGLRHG